MTNECRSPQPVRQISVTSLRCGQNFIFLVFVTKPFLVGQIANLPSLALVSDTQFGQINNLSYNFGQTQFNQ